MQKLLQARGLTKENIFFQDMNEAQILFNLASKMVKFKKFSTRLKQAISIFRVFFCDAALHQSTDCPIVNYL